MRLLRAGLVLAAFAAALVFTIYMLALPVRHAHAHDDGRYAYEPGYIVQTIVATRSGAIAYKADYVDVLYVDKEACERSPAVQNGAAVLANGMSVRAVCIVDPLHRP